MYNVLNINILFNMALLLPFQHYLPITGREIERELSLDC